MDDSSKDVTVTDDGVEVQRTIDDRPSATVVVYRLQTFESAPRVVQVEEAIPPQDSIEVFDFHPSHLPDDWTQGDGTVQFDVVVSPNETRMVVLGIESTEETPLGRGEPTIAHPEREVEALRNADDPAPITTASETDELDDGRPSALDQDADAVADGGDATADSDSILDLPDPNGDEPTAGDDDTTAASTPDSDTPAGEPATESSDDVDVEPAEPTEPDESVESAESAEPAEPAESAEPAEPAESADPVESDGPAEADELVEPAEPTESDEPADPEADDAEDSEEDLALDDSRDDPAADLGLGDEHAGGAAADSDSLVGALLADIRAGHADEAALDALRSELGGTRADEVRVQHVQSRMSDFEAYADALEEIINSHGTATEFVDGIERSVTDLEDELGVVRESLTAVENDLETAAADRDELADEVAAVEATADDLADDVADLHDLVETVDDRTETLETELRADIDALREERAAEVERIEAEFESELDDLREDVESFNELRRTLLDAFGSGLDVTADDTAER